MREMRMEEVFCAECVETVGKCSVCDETVIMMFRDKLIDIKELYGETAKLAEINNYIEAAKKIAGEGNIVILTGTAPVWLYLKIAHALFRRAKKLVYRSPITGEGDVVIFNHSY